MKKASDISVYVPELLTIFLMRRAEAFFSTAVRIVCRRITSLWKQLHKFAPVLQLDHSSWKCFRCLNVFLSSRIKFKLPLALRLTAILFSRTLLLSTRQRISNIAVNSVFSRGCIAPQNKRVQNWKITDWPRKHEVAWLHTINRS